MFPILADTFPAEATVLAPPVEAKAFPGDLPNTILSDKLGKLT